MLRAQIKACVINLLLVQCLLNQSSWRVCNIWLNQPARACLVLSLQCAFEYTNGCLNGLFWSCLESRVLLSSTLCYHPPLQEKVLVPTARELLIQLLRLMTSHSGSSAIDAFFSGVTAPASMLINADTGAVTPWSTPVMSVAVPVQASLGREARACTFIHSQNNFFAKLNGLSRSKRFKYNRGQTFCCTHMDQQKITS